MYDFTYNVLEQGLSDLKLFSGMNSNENRTLYLHKLPAHEALHDCWQIASKLDTCIDGHYRCDKIEAIALNGIVFMPS